jgi:phosphatidylglycerophosphatase A
MNQRTDALHTGVRSRLPITFHLITTFGLGHMRPASGTWGSMPPVAVALLLMLAGAGPRDGVNAIVYFATLTLILVAFCWACIAHGDRAEARFGEKDPSEVVADETAGMCIPLLAIPASGLETWPKALFTLALCFVAFRIMDIIKPPPARGLQRIPGGWGILIDDLVAGLYAAILVNLFLLALP